MDGIDGTNRNSVISNVPPPSLLIVILDCSPASWAHLDESLSLSAVLKTLIVFLNAHLALNHTNRVAVLACHAEAVRWLYSTPASSRSFPDFNLELDAFEPSSDKFRPFAIVENQIRSNLALLLKSDFSEASLESPPLLSAALSTALTYANIQFLQSAPINSGSDSKGLRTGVGDLDVYTSATRSVNLGPQLVSRILVFSVSTADSSNQYISLMNGVFAAQHLNVPIDMIRIGPKMSSMAFLQQTCDVTHGIFMQYDPFEEPDETEVIDNGDSNEFEDEAGSKSDNHVVGLLQTLMMAYLPDLTARKHLLACGNAEVDLRAACFCHGQVVSSGAICSVCLSIFCLPLAPDLTHCPTCNSKLRISPSLSVVPVTCLDEVNQTEIHEKNGGESGDENMDSPASDSN